MKAVFVELPSFGRRRSDYLDDAGFHALQLHLLADPAAGDVIQGTGGLRKLRWSDRRRGKGKRGGLRVIYYYWVSGTQFWLFTVFAKNEMSDLSKRERDALAALLAGELAERT